MAIESRNPATEELIETFEALSRAAIESKLEASQRAFHSYRNSSFLERARNMIRAAEILEEEKHRFADIITGEMGKPRAASVSEVEKCAVVCRFYAENAEAFLADQVIETDASKSFVRHLPIGPVLAVMPWNFPFWQVFRFAAPNLMAGNVGLLKHASNVPRCALAIEDLLARAGFPPAVFQTLLVGSDAIDGVIADDRVRAVTLTGSEPAGRSVAAAAGKAIKKTVLELGGSDAFLVMPSADLEAAVATAVKARMINNGQSCIAAKRFIVHADIYDAFVERMAERVAGLSVGDPMVEATDIGPLATSGIRDGVDEQVSASLAAGGRRIIGARKREGRGYFYEPGLIDHLPENAPAVQEEVFGPVALLFKTDSLAAAIALANHSRYGLGSTIFSRDDAEIAEAIDGIEAGSTFVNAQVASDPRLPFGGVKASGYGRELSKAGILEFVNQKTISIA